MNLQNTKSTDWRKGKTLSECNIYMMTNQIQCDVTLLVGPEKEQMKAHRYILVSKSSVFESMLDTRSTDTEEITLSDVDPVIFKQILKFLYSDEINITPLNVFAVIKLAFLFSLYSLQDRCFCFLESNITVDSVCSTAELAHVHSRNELWETAMNYIEQHSSEIAQSTSLSNLCHGCLQRFVTTATAVNESTIFEAVVTWSINECERRGRETTPENQRDVIGSILFDIRFPLMNPSFFVNTVSRSGLLTDRERIIVLEKMVCPDLSSSPFLSAPRKEELFRAIRFSSEEGKWTYDYSFDEAISFKSDHKIKLCGCILYGPNTDTKATYKIKLSVVKENQSIFETMKFSTSVEASRDDVTYDVMFPNGLSLDANEFYSLVVNITGPPSFKGVKGKSSVVTGEVTFVFNNSKRSTNSTTLTSGQIPGLIFKKEL